ncbi:MAG: YihY family inner membrane protein [Candidatus Dadabacteria bacterium]|nr:MAG: YihY family inner membrane protein [Candidatus Dadabacteria bacterium]
MGSSGQEKQQIGIHWSVVTLLKRSVRVIVAAADRFYRDNGFSRSASLAYTTLLSLVPAMALGFGWLASFAVSKQYVSQVREFLFHHFVPIPDTVDIVLDYLTRFSAAISELNVLVIGFLVVTSLLLINSVEYALNEIWQVFEPRPVPHRIAIFCAIIVIGPVILISAWYFTKLRLEPFISGVTYFQHEITAIYGLILPYLVDCSAFLALYYLVPKAGVRFRPALFGAMIAALLFALVKTAFVIYIRDFSSYDRVYGALAAIPVFLVWLYLLWTVILYGAECAYQAQYLPEQGKVFKHSVMSIGAGRFVLALQVLVAVARAFLDGKELPTEQGLAEKLGCSTVILKPILADLERSGLLTRGAGREKYVTFLKNPEKILISDVKEAVFKEQPQELYFEEMQTIFRAFEKRQAAEEFGLLELLKVGSSAAAT